MSDLSTRILDETFHERADGLPPAEFAPERIMRAARARQRRQRAYGVLGGAAAAAVVVALALQSGQTTSAPPRPAGTSNSMEEVLTLDQAARANASHAWALSLPPGPPESRQLGYAVERRGGQVAVVLDRGAALLPPEVRAVSSPTRVADGWLFIGHRADSTGEHGADALGSMVLHLGDDLAVRIVTEAEVVGSMLPAPDGRGFAVVTGLRRADTVEYHGRRFVLASGDTVDVQFPNPEPAAVATWAGNRVSFVGADGPGASGVQVYDLAKKAWTEESLPGSSMRDTTVTLAAAAGANGGSTDLAVVALRSLDESCLHRMTGSSVGTEPLLCGPNDRNLLARMSPDGRYAIVGEGWNGRVNTGGPARVIDLRTGADVPDVPHQLLDVGAFFLSWEDDHTLVGQATRAKPVHDAATLFRWDLATSRGESLGFDPAGGPLPVVTNPDEDVLL